MKQSATHKSRWHRNPAPSHQTRMSGGLEGTVQGVTMHTPEGYAVLRVRIAGQRHPVVVTGVLQEVVAGMSLQASGKWVNHPTYGPQFKADRMVAVAPSHADGIQKYLASPAVKGVGKGLAKRLVDAFGDDTLKVIEETPDRLREVEGIGKKKRDALVSAIQESQGVQRVMVFLHRHGLGADRAYRVYKEYGDAAIEKITRNPYQLVRDIRGIGFALADQLAQRLDIPAHSEHRLRVGLLHVIEEAAGREGHTGLKINDLLDRAVELLAVTRREIEAALQKELEADGYSGLISRRIDGEQIVFSAIRFRHERAIAEHLHNLLAEGDRIGPEQVEAALAYALERQEVQLAPQQIAAVRLAVQHPVAIITGGPGVGKTTVVRTVLDALDFLGYRQAIMTAPAAIAAKRLGHATGREGMTIHRALEPGGEGGGFKHDKDNPLEGDVFVMDEASMTDVWLAATALSAIPTRMKLIFVGDPDQIPSVGPGAVLRDLLADQTVPSVRLDVTHRQAQGSRIITNAHRVIRGKSPEIPEKGVESDFYFFEIREGEEETPAAIAERTQRAVLKLICEKIPEKFGFDPLNDIQALTPMHGGAVGTRALNAALKARLSPAQGPTVNRYGTDWSIGDKVIHTRNDAQRGVFNGDAGRIVAIDEHRKMVEVAMTEGSFGFSFDELDVLQLAYALSIHKSQGSEYPAVVIPLTTQHAMMLERHLLFTGITRAKQLLVLVGQRRALDMAIRNARSNARITSLPYHLSRISRH